MVDTSLAGERRHLSQADTTRTARMPSAPLCAILLLAAFSLFTVLHGQGGIPPLDRLAFAIASLFGQGPIDEALTLLTQLGSPVVDVLLTSMLVCTLIVRGRRGAALLTVATIMALLIVEGILRLQLSGLPWRHPYGLMSQLLQAYLLGGGYPSGHVARLMLLAGISVALLPTHHRAIGVAIALLLAGGVATERVASGHHTVSDAIGGLLLGSGLACVYAGVLNWAGARTLSAHR